MLGKVIAIILDNDDTNEFDSKGYEKAKDSVSQVAAAVGGVAGEIITLAQNVADERISSLNEIEDEKIRITNIIGIPSF
ncbi:MAG: hypothetical protein LBI11_05695 [Streptococcaceae bacterium]|nr:hypothetical protein [Streptococcaceae bacterium]